MEQLVIRPGDRGDLPAIALLQAAALEASHWPPEDYLAYTLDVAQLDGQLAGFLVSRQLVEGESEILNVVVGSAYRRRGIGTKLLEAAILRSPGRWFLEVRSSNLAARACYENMGFRNIGVRKAYYGTEIGKSGEEGIVMEKGW